MSDLRPKSDQHHGQDCSKQPGPRMILEQLRVAHVALRVSTDLCRDTSIILKMEAPLAAADVRKPDRSE